METEHAPDTVRAFLRGPMTVRWPNGSGELNLSAAAHTLKRPYRQLRAWILGDRLPSAGELDVLTEQLGMSDAERTQALIILAREERGRSPQPNEE